MFVPPGDDPRSEGGYTNERELLVGYLRDYRLTLRMKCAGLDAEALARRAVPPSDLSLLGLVRHMAAVEQSWFRRVLAGEDVPRHFRTAEGRDLDFTEAVADPEVVEAAWSLWRAEVAFAEKFTAEAPGLDIRGRRLHPELQLREILVHMIEEYARHCGHADFLRECVDGRTGA
ncbi:DinB family protein [Streptomyces sp. NPDC050560]|uniref:DinB family protein n=1 Tax=Streptomyces sp. NPDC050560 TaxID=3365630 RepID=UPI00378C49D3